MRLEQSILRVIKENQKKHGHTKTLLNYLSKIQSFVGKNKVN